MNQSSWHDINSPGVFRPQDRECVSSQAEEPAEESSQQGGSEVRFIDGSWVKPAEGFRFNESCTVRVKAEYLVFSMRTRVTFNLFVRYNGQEEDLRNEVAAHLDDNCEAEAQVKLFYGDKYYRDLQRDPSVTCEYLFRVTHSRGANVFTSEPLAMPANAAASGAKMEIVDAPRQFAPTVEPCTIVYRIAEGALLGDETAVISIKDASGTVVFEMRDLPVDSGIQHAFGWNGQGANGACLRAGSGPFAVTVMLAGNPRSESEPRQVAVEIAECTVEIAGLDANSRLVVNDPELDVEVCATVWYKKSDGSKAAAGVPADVLFGFSDPNPANLAAASSYQHSAGKHLGKGGDPNAVYWKAHPSFPANSADGFKTECSVAVATAAGSTDIGKAKAYFKPSAAGKDDFKIKVRVMHPDGAAELANGECGAFAVWRRIEYAAVCTMNGETYIDIATQHGEIGPAFESTGANGAYVLYARSAVTTLPAAVTAKYLGLYDAAAANRQANWPDDFSPAKLEASPNQMAPTADELNDYAYAGADPATVLKKIAAAAAITAKAELWFNAIVNDYCDRVSNWFAAAGVTGPNALLAVQYYHPKLSGVGTDGQTEFWPAGININLANPGSGLIDQGDPDRATWREVQGFNRGSISVIFKNYGSAARLKTVCRHEIGHATGGVFKRAEFGTGDHSGSGLMTPDGASSTFSNADAAKLRGAL